jgi:hypothetical protein
MRGLVIALLFCSCSRDYTCTTTLNTTIEGESSYTSTRVTETEFKSVTRKEMEQYEIDNTGSFLTYAQGANDFVPVITEAVTVCEVK